jgi:hypothetical protein
MRAPHTSRTLVMHDVHLQVQPLKNRSQGGFLKLNSEWFHAGIIPRFCAQHEASFA